MLVNSAILSVAGLDIRGYFCSDGDLWEELQVLGLPELFIGAKRIPIFGDTTEPG